ncbi:MAG: hypothetical protein R3F30_04005 [Planctomycetota bacterium]
MVVLVSCTAPWAVAQTKLVFPEGLANQPGIGSIGVLRGRSTVPGPRATQAVFETKKGQNGTVQAISFRPISQAADGCPAFKAKLILAFSHCPRKVTALSHVLADNRGKDFTVVAQGQYAFPAVPAQYRNISPFVFRIPFQKSFTLNELDTAMFELHVLENDLGGPTQNNGGAEIDAWGHQPISDPRYAITLFGKSCPRAGYENFFITGLFAVGHNFLMGKDPVSPFGPNTIPVAFMGASRSKFGGLSLPFDLSPLGAPGCSLYVSTDILLLPFWWGSSRSWPAMGWWNDQVPLDNRLSGMTVYFQAFSLNSVNPLGVTSSNGVEVKIGPYYPTSIGWVYSYEEFDGMWPELGAPNAAGCPVFQLELK